MMSSIDPWFFNDLSLKYLATVETIRVLWRQFRAEFGIKNFIDNIFQQRGISRLSSATLANLIARKFNSFVDKLMLPTSMKNDLSFYFWLMLQSVFAEFEQYQWVNRYAISLDMVERVSNWMQCIAWNYIGCFDRKEVVELCLSDKETLRYREWAVLCYSCSEDYIRKFADTVDWTKSEFLADLCVFWYYTIYGTFPTEDMFATPQDFIKFEDKRQAGMYEENNIMITLLTDSVLSGSLWTVKYVCNKLTDAQKLKILSETDIFYDAKGDIAVYLLSQIKFNYSSTGFLDCGPWMDLLRWPWMLFIDSWIDKCKDMDGDQFVAIFIGLTEQRWGEQVAGVEGFSRRQIWDYVHTKYYVPCEKLWTLCCEKFGLWHESVFQIVCVILNSEDIVLCKIIMKGSMSEWRQASLINILHREISVLHLSNREFCDKFMEEVLVDIEEKKLFQILVDKVFVQREPIGLDQIL